MVKDHMLGLVSPPVVEQGYSITRAERLTSSGMLVDHLNRNWKIVHYLVISNRFGSNSVSTIAFVYSFMSHTEVCRLIVQWKWLIGTTSQGGD